MLNLLKASANDCKKQIKFLLLFSLLIRIVIMFLAIAAGSFGSDYLDFLMFLKLPEHYDWFDIAVCIPSYFIRFFATEVFITLPIYLIFSKGNLKPFFKSRVRSFLIFKALLFIFYSILMFIKWHSYSKPIIYSVAFIALFSVFFKNMVKVTVVTENISAFNAIKKSFDLLEKQKLKHIVTYYLVELILFSPYILVMLLAVITKGEFYRYYILSWSLAASPIISIFTEPLQIALNLNFFYPKAKYDNIKV